MTKFFIDEVLVGKIKYLLVRGRDDVKVRFDLMKNEVSVVRETSSKMKNDVWEAQRPNHYQKFPKVPQEATVDVVFLSFGYLNESQRMNVVSAVEIVCGLMRQRRKF